MGIVRSLVCGTTVAVLLCLWPPGLVNGLDGAAESEDQDASGYLEQNNKMRDLAGKMNGSTEYGIFLREGATAPDYGSAQLVFSINITKLYTTLRLRCGSIHSREIAGFASNYAEWSGGEIHRATLRCDKAVSKLENIIYHLGAVFSRSQTGDVILMNHRPSTGTMAAVPEREKRLVGVIAASALVVGGVSIVASGISSVLGGVTADDLNRLGDRVELLDEEVKEIAAAILQIDSEVNRIMNSINRFEENIRQQSRDQYYLESANAARHLAAEVDSIVTSLGVTANAIVDNRFDISLLGEKAVHNAYDKISAAAKRRGLAIAVDKTHPRLLSQLPASFLITSRGNLRIFAHLPLTVPESTLQIWKFVPMPFRADGGFFRVETEFQYLAYNKHYYKSLTGPEFGGCRSIGDFRWCGGLMTLTKRNAKKDSTDSCLMKLVDLRVNDSQILSSCQLTQMGEKGVVPVDGVGEYILYGMGGEVAEEYCAGGKPQETFGLTDLMHIWVSSGCTLETDSHSLPGKVSVSPSAVVRDSASDVYLDLLKRASPYPSKGGSSKAATDMITRATYSTTQFRRVVTTSKRRVLQTIKNRSAYKHEEVSDGVLANLLRDVQTYIAIAASVIFLVVAVMLLCFFKKKCSDRQAPTYTVVSQPAGPVLMNQAPPTMATPAQLPGPTIPLSPPPTAPGMHEMQESAPPAYNKCSSD